MKQPAAEKALPSPGRVWICQDCGEPCAVTRQDIGPWIGQERYWEYRSDCCSAQYEEEDPEADFNDPYAD